MNTQIIQQKLSRPKGSIISYRTLFWDTFLAHSGSVQETLLLIGEVLDSQYLDYENAHLKHNWRTRCCRYIVGFKKPYVEVRERSLIIEALTNTGDSVAGVGFTTECPDNHEIRCYQDGVYRYPCQDKSALKWHAIAAESKAGMMLGVDQEYRRQGLAFRMYELALIAAKGLELSIVPSKNLEPGGRGLWNKLISQSLVTLSEEYINRVTDENMTDRQLGLQ